MRRRMTLLVLAAACLYLVGNDRIALWDRDEPRYAQTSRQMLQSGDWVVPHFLDDIRTAKPVFIYWCQAAAMRVMGDTAFAARFPSAMGMTLVLIVFGAAVWRGIGPVHALWSVLILSTCFLIISAAKMCLTDAVLLLWITLAQTCVFVIYHGSGVGQGTRLAVADRGVGGASRLLVSRGARAWTPLVLWISVGLAGLTKGPVVLGVMGTTLIVLAVFDVGRQWRSGRAWLDAVWWWRRLRPMLGLLVVAVIVGPWLYLVAKRAPHFIGQSVTHEIWQRMHTGLEQHKGPPGFYVLTLMGMFMPWSLILPAAVVLAWQNRSLSDVRFSLAAAIGPWIMFELIQTKLPHYLLPIYPPLALLCADLLVRVLRRETQLLRPDFFVGVAVWGLAVIFIGALPWLAMRSFVQLPWTAMIVLGGWCVIWAISVFILFYYRRVGAAAGAMAAGMAVFTTLLCGWYLPQASFLKLPETLAAVLREHRAIQPGDQMMIDYKEPSLAFYQGGTIREQANNNYLAITPPAKWPNWFVMTHAIWDQTPIDRRKLLERIDTQRGLDYADQGKIVEVIIARKRPTTRAS